MSLGFQSLTNRYSSRQSFRAIAACCWAVLALSATFADETPDSTQSVKHQVTGLFSKERIPDFEKVVKTMPNLQLVSVDFATAEAILRYDPMKLFPNQPPEKVVEELDNRFKNASRHTFGIKPLCTTPRDKLKLVEIPVYGLDCKACCLVAYEAVYRVDGVEQATASFKDRLVTAWINPDKVNREKLEEELGKRNVALKNAAEEK